MFFFALSLYVLLAVLGLIVVHLAPSYLERVADGVRRDFLRSFGVGLLGQILFFPALLFLTVLILTLPLVPVVAAGVGLATLIGYLAVAYAAGEMIREQEHEWSEALRQGGPMRTLLVGLGALLLLFAVAGPFELLGPLGIFFEVPLLIGAWTVTWIAVTAGFGAILLSLRGWRPDRTAPAPSSAPPAGSSPAESPPAGSASA